MANLHPQLERCYELAIKGAWHHPFFLIPLGHCEWREGDPKLVPTAAVHPVIQDGNATIILEINTEWVAGVPDDQVFGMLCHEILHCMLQHHERGGGKNQKTWGEATDMAINQSLVDSSIKIGKDWLLPPSGHSEESADELYELLDKGEEDHPKQTDPNQVGKGCMPQKGSNPQGENQSQGDQPNPGSGDGGNEPGEGQSDQAPQSGGQGGQASESSDRAWGEMVAQAAVMGRGQGTAKAIARLFTPAPIKTKWDRLLKSKANRAASKGGRDAQTYSRVNRRSTDIVLPGWQSHRPSITIVIDSSGSVSDEMLRSALTSAVEIARIGDVKVFLALHDGICYFADWIKPETTVESLSALCTHRGGTRPEPAFDAVGEAKGRFSEMVYLTDGEVGAYPPKPRNVKHVTVGIVGDRKSTYRAQIPDGWQEVLVEIDGNIGRDA